MQHDQILDAIVARLLTINKEEYTRTGTAPKLSVYLAPGIMRGIVRSINFNMSTRVRDTDFTNKQEIMGYPVFEISLNSAEDHPQYTIVQIHHEV